MKWPWSKDKPASDVPGLLVQVNALIAIQKETSKRTANDEEALKILDTVLAIPTLPALERSAVEIAKSYLRKNIGKKMTPMEESLDAVERGGVIAGLRRAVIVLSVK